MSGSSDTSDTKNMLLVFPLTAKLMQSKDNKILWKYFLDCKFSTLLLSMLGIPV